MTPETRAMQQLWGASVRLEMAAGLFREVGFDAHADECDRLRTEAALLLDGRHGTVGGKQCSG